MKDVRPGELEEAAYIDLERAACPTLGDDDLAHLDGASPSSHPCGR